MNIFSFLFPCTNYTRILYWNLYIGGEQNLSLLEEALKTVNSADPAIVCAIIDQFSLKASPKECSAIWRWVMSELRHTFSMGKNNQFI